MKIGFRCQVSGVRVLAFGNNHARGIRNSEVGMRNVEREARSRMPGSGLKIVVDREELLKFLTPAF